MEGTLLVLKFVVQPWVEKQSVGVSQSGETLAGSGQTPGLGQKVVTAPKDLVADPIWKRPLQLSLNIYISTTDSPGKVLQHDTGPDVNLAHLSWDNIKWGSWDIQHNWTGDIPIPSVRTSCNRGVSLQWHSRHLSSLFRTMNPRFGLTYSWPLMAPTTYQMVVDLTQRRFTMLRNVGDRRQLEPTACSLAIPKGLTRYMPRKKAVRGKNLLSSDQNDTPEPEEETDVSNCPPHVFSVLHSSI